MDCGLVKDTGVQRLFYHCFSFHQHWEHYDSVSQHPLQPQSCDIGGLFLLTLCSSGSLLWQLWSCWKALQPIFPDATWEGAEERSSSSQAQSKSFSELPKQLLLTDLINFKYPLSHNLLNSYKISRNPGDTVTKEQPAAGEM